MVKFHIVSLSPLERDELTRTVSRGTAPARIVRRARVLLKADTGPAGPGWEDGMIADAVEVSIPTIERVRKRAVTEGVEAAIHDRPHPPRGGKLDSSQEARLTALACSAPPTGQKRWTRALLVEGFEALDGGVHVSDGTVRRILKKPIVASPEGTMVHSTQAECRVCVAHGGRALGLHPPL